MPSTDIFLIQSLIDLCEYSSCPLACGWQGEICLFYAKLLERFSISLYLNSMPLSECNILGKPNFNVMSGNK